MNRRLHIIRILRWGLPLISIGLVIFMIVMSSLNQEAPLNIIGQGPSPALGLQKPQLYLVTSKGDRVTIQADSALSEVDIKTPTQTPERIDLDNIHGTIQKNNGDTITLRAPLGSYQATGQVIHLKNQLTAVGPQGSLKADRATIPLDDKAIIRFDGHVSMVYTPK